MLRVPVGTQIPVEVVQREGSRKEISALKHVQFNMTGANPDQYIFRPASAERSYRIESISVQITDDVPGVNSDVVMSLYASSSLGRMQFPAWYAEFMYNANARWYFEPGLDFGTVGIITLCYPLFNYMLTEGDWLQIDTVGDLNDIKVFTILYREYWNKEL